MGTWEPGRTRRRSAVASATTTSAVALADPGLDVLAQDEALAGLQGSWVGAGVAPGRRSLERVEAARAESAEEIGDVALGSDISQEIVSWFYPRPVAVGCRTY